MSDQDKITTPPPAMDEEDSEDIGGRTVVHNLSEEMIASTRTPAPPPLPAPPPPTPPPRAASGLKQMFSRDPARVREALPDPGEGDALLDMLFDDAKAGTEDVRARPSGIAQARPLAPPLPPRPMAAKAPAPAAPRPTPSPMAVDPERPSPAARLDTAPATRPTPHVAPPAATPDPRATVPGDDLLVERVDSDADVEELLSSPPEVSQVDDDDEGTPFDEAYAQAGPETEDPPAPAQRLAPVPSKPPPAPVFTNERDAAAHLVDSHQRDAWATRAAWLREEANRITDPATRARLLVAVSELYVMAGEEPAAMSAAQAAVGAAPSAPLAARQLRGLLARDGDWRAVLDGVDGEARTAPTAAARAHAAMFGAAIARIRLDDVEGASRRVELAAKATPADARPHLERLVDALAADPVDASAAIARIKLPPDMPHLAAISEAGARVLALRAPAPRSDRPTFNAYEAVLRARAALAANDPDSAVAALGELPRDESLSGAPWLVAALAAPRRGSRGAAAAALEYVAGGSHGDLARRALAARAIESGDAAAARAATAGAGQAFSTFDKIALAALTGAPASDVQAFADDAPPGGDIGAILAAVTAALAEPGAPDRKPFQVGDDRGKSSVALARSLGAASKTNDVPLSSDEGVTAAANAYGDAWAESPIAQALGLELDLESGAGGRVARALSSWGRRDSRPTGDDGVDRDRALAGALLAEAAGEPERATGDLDRARLVDPSHEGAARARAAHADASTAAKVLAEHAIALEDGGTRAAVLLTEAAQRLVDAEAAEEAEPLLTRAAQLDPKLPVALYLAERSARARGDRDALVEWLRARREASDDPTEQAYDLVREALLLSDMEGSAASSLLEQALRARPKDAGLRELYERLASETPLDRADWRAARASELQGAEAARLALEAAIEYERAGKLDRTAEMARLAQGGGDPIAPLVALRAALAGYGAGELVDAMLPKARELTDPVERLEMYEQLAELDEKGRGDAASGLLWRRTIIEETPSHLPTLRRAASELIAGGRDEELEPIALEIAKALEGSEAVAHALLSARLRLKAAGWEETRESVDVAYKHEPRGVWTLRQMAAHARAKGQHALALQADRELLARAERPNERATLAMRAAEAATRLGDMPAAVSLLRGAANDAPEHFAVHIALAEALEAADDAAGAAESHEAAAAVSQLPEEKARSTYRAAILWQEHVKEGARARAALEAVAAIDPSYADVFARLQAVYVAEGARAELAKLLERRLDRITDPGERVEMEVLRGRALAEVGDSAAAKRALAAALDHSPDHVEALGAFADLCASEEDWSGAEQAWIRLARLVSEPARQSAIYFKLGELYDEHLPNKDRAELAYQEIIKRAPNDEGARERLVSLYKRSGDIAKAMEQQTVLITAAVSPEDKCKRTCELAEIYEATGDTKKAEATLQGARKTYPKDDVALGALARFYQRTGQAPTAAVLLDRAAADARRALATGRFEPYLFSSIATVAELRGRPDAATVARSTVESLEGNDAAMPGAHSQAADPRLDDLLAPEVMTPAFRELLLKTGPLLDTAVPFDLAAVRATPLAPQQAEIANEIRELAQAYGLPGVQAHVSAALGAVCVAASSHPPTLVLGQGLVASPRRDVREFMLHRALKVLQSNSSAFSRTAPINLWPLLAAYLKAFSQAWAPQGVDGGKLTDWYGRVTRAMPPRLDQQVGLLAADVIGSIGNRASTLNAAVNGWGNRCGLVAVGDPNVALSGIAWAGGHANAPPAAGKDRLTWIGRNAEARDLIVFSVSDAYFDARTRLGLGK